jgi:preprotein translocase subunit SecY
MIERITSAFKVKSLRKKILVTLGLLVVFRLIAAIPVPGVDQNALTLFFNQNKIFGLVDVFSGGGLSTFSLAMLGVGPYITASIIFQLLTTVVPKLKQYQKEGGEAGRRKINQYTRLVAVPLGFLQAYGSIVLLNRNSQTPILPNLTTFKLIAILIAAVGGSMFLMWLGETITEIGIGNGVSLIIFAGIVSRLPRAFSQTAATYDSSQLGKYALLAAGGVVLIAAIVFITQGMRKIPVSYARRVSGARQLGGTTSSLPLPVNQGGVIPIIFALSVMLFPGVIANFFVGSSNLTVSNFANQVIAFFNNQTYYAILYFIMVLAFTYFYTTVTFIPEDVAENIQKSGGFVPGIRPGNPTAQYLSYVTNRITLAGALFLGVVAVIPIIVQNYLGFSSLSIGGTSLLIVVSVALEVIKQVEAQIVMHDYEGI